MTNQPAIHRSVLLNSQQEAFVTTVLSAPSPALHVLYAPPGTGKGTVAVEAVGRLSRSNPSSRALLLCPAALVQQFASRLAAFDPNSKVEVVDRHRFRELEAAASIDGSPFAPSTIAVLSIDLAKHTDVARGLLATSWDLLVVDEAHALAGQRGQLVQQLVNSGKVDRTIVMSASPIEGLDLSRALVSKWDGGDVSGLGESAIRPVRVVAVPYTDAEKAVFKEIHSLADGLARSGAPFVGQMILAQAYSCFYSLERTLHNMRNESLHGLSLSTEASGNEDGFAAAVASPLWLPERAERILTLMDEVAVDSKTEALCRLLAERLSSQDRRTAIILSRYVGTAEYLAVTLANRGMNVRLMTASMTPKRFEAVAGETSDPGITVMTIASMQGFEFPAVETWVLYEKMDDVTRHIIWSRVLREQRLLPPEILEFEGPPSKEPVS